LKWNKSEQTRSERSGAERSGTGGRD